MYRRCSCSNTVVVLLLVVDRIRVVCVLVSLLVVVVVIALSCFFLANPGHYWIRVCGPPLSLSRAGDQILAKPAYVVLFSCFKHEPLFQNV